MSSGVHYIRNARRFPLCCRLGLWLVPVLTVLLRVLIGNVEARAVASPRCTAALRATHVLEEGGHLADVRLQASTAGISPPLRDQAAAVQRAAAAAAATAAAAVVARGLT